MESPQFFKMVWKNKPSPGNTLADVSHSAFSTHPGCTSTDYLSRLADSNDVIRDSNHVTHIG